MKECAPDEAGFSPHRLRHINRMMQGYVEQGLLAGIATLIARRGCVVHFDRFGYRDVAAGRPIESDTLFRIYSMTKPITSVALMTLFEEGLVRLSDPVSRFLPEFSEIKVFEPGGKLAEPRRPITVHDLLTHTSGLSYGNYEDPPLPQIFRQIDTYRSDITNQEFARQIAQTPLLFHPGERWHYSVATDVVGHLVEVISGMSLGRFFADRIFKPLGMLDTSFAVPPERRDRFAVLYGLTPEAPLGLIGDDVGGDYFQGKLESGGGGLVSTMSDYLRFAQCILRKGELEGVRILGRKTVELMTANHLPQEMLPMVMTEPMPGFGFGLGFNVLMDAAQAGILGSIGSHGWGGWATTRFWVDPQEGLIAICMTQFIPTGTYPVLDDFRTLVYQALID